MEAYPHTILYTKVHSRDFPGGRVDKNPPANARDAREVGLIPSPKEHPLEKGMATYSSSLAWKIAWTEEPGELQSMGS